MALLAVVLFAVLLVFNIASYNSEYKSIMSALDYALTAGPERLNIPRIGGAPDSDSAPDDSGAPSDDGALDSIDIDSATAKDLGIQDTSIPVYCVSIASDGTVKAASNNAYMSTTLVNGALSAIASSGETSGELSDMGLFFSMSEYKNEFRIAFADSDTLHEDTTTRALYSLLIGAGTLGVLFLVSLWLSRFTLKPVRRAWDGQQRFIADASHELKTPLTVILANNDIVLAHPDSTVEEQRRWIEATNDEAERMQGLVKDLLVLAQTEPDNIQTFRANLQMETLDFSSIVEMDILQFEAVAFDKGIEMEEHVEEGLMVKADSDKLERVVRVLLDNACKYASCGSDDAEAEATAEAAAEAGVEPSTLREAGSLVAGPNGFVAPAVFSTRTNYVKVDLHREKSQGVLVVNNGGDPISPEDLPHVFEKFYRSDKARTGKTEGHGLGLSIAKNIVEGFGGTIEVESNIFDGTTFTVRLPLA